MSLNKKTILFLAVTILIVSFLFSLSPVFAQFGIDETAKEAGLQKSDPAEVVGTGIGAVLAFVGVVFFGLMVYGGMIWLTARGNEKRVEKAKEIIISAVVGIAIVFVSYGITSLIIDRFAKNQSGSSTTSQSNEQ